MIEINYLAVFVAAVVGGVGLGSLWYSQLMFGKKFMMYVAKNIDSSSTQKPNMARIYTLTFIGSLVSSYVLAHFVYYTGAVSFADGMITGFWAWLGFVVTVELNTVLFENRSKGLYYLSAGYQLVALMLMGGILAIWQ